VSQFRYRALHSDGSVTEGLLEAGGRPDAFRQIEALGYTPVSLNESGEKDDGQPFGFKLSLQRKAVSFRTLENFTRQLASLLAAGVSLSRALQIVSRESTSVAASARWKEVYDLIVDGASLADAMATSPGTFPKVYTAMVQAGEAGGFLDRVLRQIAEFQSREKELRSKVTSALIYPAVLMALALVVLVFLLVFFIPRFEIIFVEFDAALPLITRMIIGVSEALIQYGLFVLAAAALALVLARQWLQTEHGRRTWEQAILAVPVVGPLTARFAMTRFCRMLGTLVGSGVPLIQALRVARESLGNQILVDAVTASIDQVQKGDSLASSLASCPALFPGSVLEMISVAEETGRLDEELVRLAAVTENDLDRQLKASVSLAEPLMLFVMAGFIGIIFVGMVIPIFSLQDYIQ
jgi:type II secretory pathway component PulF